MNYYDQTLIDRYGERKIRKWILDSKKMDKIYSNKKKYYEYKGDLNANYVIMGDAIDNYMAKYILSSPNLKNKTNKQIVENYWKKAYEEVKVERERIFSNPVFNLPDSAIQPIFGQDGVESINKRQNILSRRAKEIYKKYVNQEGVNLSEREELIDFLLHTINNDSTLKAARNVVEDIVNLEDYATLKEKSLVYQFLAKEYCSKENLYANVYLSDYPIGSKKKFAANEFGEQHKGVVALSKFFIERTDFAKMEDELKTKKDLQAMRKTKEKLSCVRSIQGLYHELTHIKQYDQMKKGYVNYQAVQMATQLADMDTRKRRAQKDYLRNYKYAEVELDANINAFKETQRFFEKYLPDRISEVKPKLTKDQMLETLKQSSAVKIDKKKNRQLPDEFNVAILDNIVSKKHKKLLTKYPQLNLFYDKKGKSKDLETLLFERERNITEKTDKNNDYKDVYYEHMNYKIDAEALTFIDLFDKTDKERKMIASSLEDVMGDQIQQIANLYRNTEYSKAARENFDFITEKRFERVEKIYSMFRMNKELFSHYDMEKVQKFKDMADMLRNNMEAAKSGEEKENENGFAKRLD